MKQAASVQNELGGLCEQELYGQCIRFCRDFSRECINFKDAVEKRWLLGHDDFSIVEFFFHLPSTSLFFVRQNA